MALVPLQASNTAALSVAESDLGSDARHHRANLGSRSHNASALGSLNALKCRYPRMEWLTTERERAVQFALYRLKKRLTSFSLNLPMRMGPLPKH
jgi:hypothetical protein